MIRNLKARLGGWFTLLALPLLLAPLLVADVGDPPKEEPPKDPPPEGDPPKSFTQEELDRIVQDRLARHKGPAPADYDDLKAKAAKFDELDAASKSELEKAMARAEAAEKTAAAAKADSANTKIETAVLLAASKAGAVKPQQVFALLPKNAVTVGDDGQVTGVEEAVKALLEENKHLVGPGNTPTGDPDGGGRGKSSPSQLSRDDLKTMTPEAIVAAKAAGKLNDLLGVT